MADIEVKYNGWNEWAKYVLKSIERLEHNITTLEDKADINKLEVLKEIADIKREIAMLKTKSAMWGAIAASIPVIIGIIITLIINF